MNKEELSTKDGVKFMDYKQPLARSSAFRAVNGTIEQRFPAGPTPNPMVFPTEVFDLNDEYDPTTSTFIPKQDGVYSIIGSVVFGPDILTNYTLRVLIMINGNIAVYDNDFFGPEVPVGNITTVTAILQLKAGDQVRIFANSLTEGVYFPVPEIMHFEAARVPSTLENYSKSNLAYTVNLFGRSITAIDLDKNIIVKTIPVGRFPFDIAITPDGERAYVTVGRDDKVAVIDTRSNTVIKMIDVGDDPADILITRNGKLAYVTNFRSSNVSVIDVRSNTVIGTIESASFANPQGVAITQFGKRIFIVNAGNDTVSVIDTETNTVIEVIPVGNIPLDAKVTPNGRYLYVTNFLSKSVSVVCIKTNIVSDTIAVGEGPDGIVFTPEGDRAYIVNELSNTVSVIDTERKEVIKTIPVGNQPVEIAITTDGALVYVTNIMDDTLSVIDTEKNMVINTIPAGDSPVSVAIRPALRREYCD